MTQTATKQQPEAALPPVTGEVSLPEMALEPDIAVKRSDRAPRSRVSKPAPGDISAPCACAMPRGRTASALHQRAPRREGGQLEHDTTAIDR